MMDWGLPGRKSRREPAKGARAGPVRAPVDHARAHAAARSRPPWTATPESLCRCRSTGDPAPVMSMTFPPGQCPRGRRRPCSWTGGDVLEPEPARLESPALMRDRRDADPHPLPPRGTTRAGGTLGGSDTDHRTPTTVVQARRPNCVSGAAPPGLRARPCPYSAAHCRECQQS